MYHFITQCLYNNSINNPAKIKVLKAYRRDLLNNDTIINVTDFGAGSKVFKSNERRISAIAKNAGITLKNTILLYKICTYFKVSRVLEIGTSLGLSTSGLSISDSVSKVITLEGCPKTSGVAKQQLNKHQFNNVNLEVGEFNQIMPKVLKNNQFDLIYFDGNHTKSATIEYFNLCKSQIKNESIFIFDDIHWSSEMESAWQHIKNDKAVSVTVDTFKWGIVFFRSEQPKQHFKIRV